MILKTTVVEYFGKSKVMFASLAMLVTFSITLYNQFKSHKSTEISGIVATTSDSTTPIDAIVKISSPIQAQTETDSNGRFKFKVKDLQSDTFLLIVENKATNVVNKQTEYVNASRGRTDIVVISKPVMPEATVAKASPSTTENRRTYKKRSGLNRTLRRIFN